MSADEEVCTQQWAKNIGEEVIMVLKAEDISVKDVMCNNSIAVERCIALQHIFYGKSTVEETFKRLHDGDWAAYSY